MTFETKYETKDGKTTAVQTKEKKDREISSMVDEAEPVPNGETKESKGKGVANGKE